MPHQFVHFVMLLGLMSLKNNNTCTSSSNCITDRPSYLLVSCAKARAEECGGWGRNGSTLSEIDVQRLVQRTIRSNNAPSDWCIYFHPRGVAPRASTFYERGLIVSLLFLEPDFFFHYGLDLNTSLYSTIKHTTGKWYGFIAVVHWTSCCSSCMSIYVILYVLLTELLICLGKKPNGAAF